MIFYTKYSPKFKQKWVTQKHRAKEGRILDIVCCLDTETSWNHDLENPIGWIYQWAVKFGTDPVVYGRTPSQFIFILKKLRDYCNLSDETKDKIVIYVHNLSYDIQYLKDFLISEFGEYKILAIDNHKFISFTCGNFIFKCSYKLSNKSLEKWGNDLNVKHKKKVGTVDYSKIRYQDTFLSDIDNEYMENDVLSMYECIETTLKLYKDTISSIPLTSTGYIRRDCRQNFKEDFITNWREFQDTKINKEVYLASRSAFMGGLTHGNRFYQEKTIKGTIRHRDFRSHYPSQQRTRDFPIGKWVKLNRNNENVSLTKLKANLKNNCALIQIVIKNPELKDKKISMPYLSVAKCKENKIGKIYCIEDNGRILKMTGITILWLTEIDLQIIFNQYKFNYIIKNVYLCRKGKLPNFMIKTIDKHFYGKTHYKKLAKKEKDPNKKFDYEMSLMKSKNGLNGIYGMSATDIVREEIIMDSYGENPWHKNKPDDIQGVIDKYYNSKNNFMRYPWGLYTTAYARKELLYFCELIGWENVLYCDTDSIFYISNDEIEEKIRLVNETMTEDSMNKKAYIKSEGEIVTYNYFDDEDENITDFRFLHAKCYAYICENKLKCVIAGVKQYEDATRKFSRENELGTIDNLKSGFKFIRCGGTRSKYVESGVETIFIDNHRIEYASSCLIIPVEKTLSTPLTNDNWWFKITV